MAIDVEFPYRKLIEDTSHRLWAKPVPDVLMRLAEGYLKYVVERQSDLVDGLSSLFGMKISRTKDSLESVLAYVAWVTLGPSSVLGFGVFQDVAKENQIRLSLSETKPRLFRNYQAWDKVSEHFPIDRISTYTRKIENRKLFLDLLRQFSRLVFLQDPEPLSDSFIIGVLGCKPQWSSPKCSSAAVNIVGRGMKERLYESLLPKSGLRVLLPDPTCNWYDDEVRLRGQLAERFG